MRFRSDNQRKAAFANMNRFSGKAEENFELYAYRGGHHGGSELSGNADKVMSEALKLTKDPGIDEIRVTDTGDNMVFHWGRKDGVIFPKKGVHFAMVPGEYVNYRDSYSFGEAMMSAKPDDYCPLQMKKGIEIEAEHKPTFRKIEAFVEEKGKFPKDEQMQEWIATDHIDEFSDYYIPHLEDAEDAMKHEREGKFSADDVVSDSKVKVLADLEGYMTGLNMPFEDKPKVVAKYAYEKSKEFPEGADEHTEYLRYAFAFAMGHRGKLAQKIDDAILKGLNEGTIKPTDKFSLAPGDKVIGIGDPGEYEFHPGVVKEGKDGKFLVEFETGSKVWYPEGKVFTQKMLDETLGISK